MFRHSLLSSVLFVCIAWSGFTFSETNLPAKHEAARLMLAVKDAVENGHWQIAQRQLTQLASLDTQLPSEYFYFKGLVQAEYGDFPSAQKSIESYVVKDGGSGEHYISALKKITHLEALSAKTTRVEATKPEISKAGSKEKGDGYLQSLQALFLTDNPVVALTMQVNSLLSSHAYTGKRLKTRQQREGIVYTLSVIDGALQIQNKAYNKGSPTLKMDKLNVLGLDPFLKYECSSSELMCWIIHPGNQYERWLIIDNDSLVVAELADALSRLIRMLQKGR